ncbi:hypothetical protein GA0074695_2465 [Micromonospora viridifaciens]|uniref:Uncharacterized protein n=1 Tax=Micromonospora viridifaciens TaxID=1881 RepID=A0A1C4WJ42_MICVI|nr:hypothetical protein GA0074695_2465 [Micromonospora viridifaciens]
MTRDKVPLGSNPAVSAKAKAYPIAGYARPLLNGCSGKAPAVRQDTEHLLLLACTEVAHHATGACRYGVDDGVPGCRIRWPGWPNNDVAEAGGGECLAGLVDGLLGVVRGRKQPLAGLFCQAFLGDRLGAVRRHPVDCCADGLGNGLRLSSLS